MPTRRPWRCERGRCRPWYALGTCGRRSRIIKINVRLHKEYRISLLSTCIHEELHRAFPEKKEHQVERLTDDIMALLTSKDKWLLTARYRRRLKL